MHGGPWPPVRETHALGSCRRNCQKSVTSILLFDDVQTLAAATKIIRAIDPDSKGRSGRVPGSQGTWDSLHFEFGGLAPLGPSSILPPGNE